MESALETQIRQLCADYKKGLVEDGGLLGARSESCRLRRNGIEFHELTYSEFCTALTELTNLILVPGGAAVIDFDHFWLWAWAAEIMFGSRGPLSSAETQDIAALATVVTRAALAQARDPRALSGPDFGRLKDALPLQAREYLESSIPVLSFLCFPFLEAAARRACSSFLDADGRVLQTFDKADGSSYAVNRLCSSLSDVLYLLQDRVAPPELKKNLTTALDHVAAIEGEPDGRAVIYNWRNPALHSGISRQTIGGTVY